MICGSIGYGGLWYIEDLYSFLCSKGFDVVNHIMDRRMNYSAIKDFRRRKRLSGKIVEHDLNYVRQADVLVVIADRPSYGTAIEVFIAKKYGKKIILLAKDPIPTPWLVNFSDYILTSQDGLVRLLHRLEKNSSARSQIK
jgi:nucleoside 2-deoxyribosyltransferase